MLEYIQELVKDEKSKRTSRLPGLIKLKTANGLLHCLSQGLQAKFETNQGCTDQTVQALMWPLKQGKAKKMVNQLREFQKLLSLARNVDIMYTCLFILRLHPNIISVKGV